ncbi:MAG: VOC family protein [Ruminococcus sp.]|nr:VOC family protein [Ruminococcus sp.]
MAIAQFGHVAFNCKNLEKSVAFYRDILGCKEKFSFLYEDFFGIIKSSGYPVPDFVFKLLEKKKNKPWLTYLEIKDGIYIELFDQLAAFICHKAKNIHLNYQHFAIIVDDIEATKADLIAKGVKIDTDISFGPDFTYQMWIHDPDGNKIEIMQYTDKSFQVVGKN